MKKILLTSLLIGLFSLPAQAKNSYQTSMDMIKAGNMSVLPHYTRFRTVGQVIRFIPNVFYVQDMAIGIAILTGGVIELVQAPMPNRDCDIKDFFADWKGLRDGLNGKDFIHDELVLKAIRESNQSIIDQKEVLELLQKRVELLEISKY